ncbi:MAG: hypothetical protein KKH08_04700, partial [Candidatus Omnitrophica bacterium]|nr:hypothetical protein [Candidatus Omnitrophota bacterium]
MRRVGFLIFLLCVVFTGCARNYDVSDIIKVTDFELSPDEEKIAFAAVTPVGNTDIWVVNIDGTGLKKLTFQDHSPSNHIARFFKKRKWRNFYEIDACFPEWTTDGRIMFCEEITKHHTFGINTYGLVYRTIKSDGTNERIKTDKDKILQRKPYDPINRPILSDKSSKHKKEILLKDNVLWIIDD